MEQTGKSWEGPRDAAAAALAAEGVLKQLAEQSQSRDASFEEQCGHAPAGIGLVMAVALSIPFWTLFAALLWLWR
jgi:hypothetical protein